MSKIKKECSLWYSLDEGAYTVGDLREFVEALNNLGVPDDYELSDCTVAFFYSGDTDLILDGESSPSKERYDILLNMDFNDKDEVETGC